MPTDSPTTLAMPRSEHAPRPTHRSGALPTLVVVVLVSASLLWLGAATATSLGGHLPALPLPAGPAPTTSSVPAHVYLTIAFNPVNGLDQYMPANFTVPAHTAVVFQITSWDDGINNVAPMYQHVTGTQNGVMTFNDGMGGASQMMSSVPAGQISHTFTVMSGMSGGMGSGMMGGGSASGPMLNVPIPAVQNLSDPVVVTFTAEFSSPGTLTWMCFAPCDPDSMGTPGYMSGTITVA